MVAGRVEVEGGNEVLIGPLIGGDGTVWSLQCSLILRCSFTATAL